MDKVARLVKWLALAARTSLPALAGLGWSLSATGCVLAPPGPRGPIRPQPGVEIGMDFSAAFNSAKATPTDGPKTQGSSDHLGSIVTAVPRRLEGRLTLSDWLDLGIDAGWVDAGADVRVGRGAVPHRSLAFAITGGAREGLRLGEGAPRPASFYGRLELYPLLHDGPPDASGLPSEGRLVLSLGLHQGTFVHALEYEPYDPAFDGPPIPSTVRVAREELRVESALGYYRSKNRGSIMAAIEPYWVIASEPRYCSGCSGYAQSFGVVVVLRVAGFFLFDPPAKPQASPRGAPPP